MSALEIRQAVDERGVTRLCHFTSSRNLAHIIRSGEVKPTDDVARDVLNTTDDLRLDGYPDHVCCSIQYPNAWYLDVARSRQGTFPDWVVLFVSPRYLFEGPTKFCQRNSASNAPAEPGYRAFAAMFAQRVQGSGGRVMLRGPSHLTCSPTDDQAEVLVAGSIRLRDLLAVGVRSVEQASLEVGRLRTAGCLPAGLRVLVAPQIFDPRALSSAIRRGEKPREVEYRADAI